MKILVSLYIKLFFGDNSMEPRPPFERSSSDDLNNEDDFSFDLEGSPDIIAITPWPFLALTARIVIFILIISILAAAFPIQLLNPLWYLKLGEICVDYSISLLFALTLIYLSSYFGSPHVSVFGQRNLFQFLVSILFLFYALLIPVQFVALGLYWQQTAQANTQTIRKAEAELDILRRRIRGTSTEDQLRSALGDAARLLPPLPGILLEERKTKLVEAIDNQLFALRSSLQNDRQQRLRTFVLSTAKGVTGAGMMTFGFSRLKRLEF